MILVLSVTNIGLIVLTGTHSDFHQKIHDDVCHQKALKLLIKSQL